MDDSFAIFVSEVDYDYFQRKLKFLHPALKITLNTLKEKYNNSLNSLDALIEKEGIVFLTRVYRKTALTEQYICLKSFSPKTRYICLIRTLVHRALMACS